MPFVPQVTQTLHKLLRGEVAALESYERLVQDLPPSDPTLPVLEAITRDHAEAREVLARSLEALGQEPDERAGGWGAYTRLLEKVGQWLGDDTELKLLKEGEVHGLAEYRTALGHDDLPGELRSEIEDRLMVRQEEHVRHLDALLKARERARHGS